LDGGNGDDSLYANADIDSVYGGSGSDTLNGGDGDDFLSGGDGNDFLFDSGANYYDGGEGNDWATIDFTADLRAFSFDLNACMSTNGQTFVNGTHLKNLEIFSIYSGFGDDQVLALSAQRLGWNASEGIDRFVGDYSNVTEMLISEPLVSGSTQYTLYSSPNLGGSKAILWNVESLQIKFGANSDNVGGLRGDDVLEGGAGSDTVRGEDGNDTIFGGLGNDSLLGGAGGDYLAGDSGDGTLDSGNDTLLGGDGNDTLNSEAGIDFIDGGAGIDWAYLNVANDTRNFILNMRTMASSTGQTLIDGTHVRNVENVSLTTGAGNDRVTTYSGQVLNWNGGGGFDRVTINFSAMTTGVVGARETANINSIFGLTATTFGDFGKVGGDVEAMIALLGSGNDSVNGLDGDDILDGGAGNDTLIGGLGNDYLYGGLGNNLLIGGAGADQVDFSEIGGNWFANLTSMASGGDVTINSSLGSNTIREVEQFIFGGGNDTIVGSAAADLVHGGAGNDWASVGDGNDSLFGGEGSDVLVLGNGDDVSSGWYQFTSPDDPATTSDLDYIYAGAGNDRIEDGGRGVSVLLGQDGNDTINVSGGVFSYLFGGTGANTMSAASSINVFISEGSADTMSGGGASNFYYRYGDGSSSVIGGTGVDQFIGGPALSDDVVNGAGGNDYLYGGAGNDLLLGGADNDVIIGQAGNDTLDGGAGVNLLWANDSGNDQIRVNVADGGTQVLDFFETGGTNDVVRLLGSSLTNFAGIQNLVDNLGVVQGNNLLINVSYGCQLYLNLGASQSAIWFQGINAYSLTSGDFVFG
jgi:Ca2+-binding RTX toxin-like protein